MSGHERRATTTRRATARRSEPEEDPRKIATGSTLADISIRNHVFAWVLMFALIGFGTICYTGFGNVFKGMGISQNPDVDFPIINVSVTYEGAAPDIIETDVVDLIEDAATTVEGVKQISSTSRQGSGNITVEFDLGRDIDAALQDVQTKIAQLPGPPAAGHRPPGDLEDEPRGPAHPPRSPSRATGRPPSSPTTSGTSSAPPCRPCRGWGRCSSRASATARCGCGTTRASSRPRASPSST